MSDPIDVEFLSDDLTIAAHLRLPVGSDERAPALLVPGPSPSVKEQAAANYAERLTARGYVTLTVDPRHFGASAGEPRQREDPAGKLTDYRAAVSFLRSHSRVDADRVGVVAICMGGGYGLRLAAFDARVKAFVGIAGFYPSPHLLRDAMGTEVYDDTLTRSLGVIERQDRGGAVEYQPHVTADGVDAAAPPGEAGKEAYDYYGTARGAAPGYENRLTRDSAYALLTTDWAIGADFLSPTPALIVHGEVDAGCPPELAKAVFDRLGEPKQILWMPTTSHVDYYDRDTHIDPAVDAAVAFLREHL